MLLPYTAIITPPGVGVEKFMRTWGSSIPWLIDFDRSQYGKELDIALEARLGRDLYKDAAKRLRKDAIMLATPVFDREHYPRELERPKVILSTHFVFAAHSQIAVLYMPKLHEHELCMAQRQASGAPGRVLFGRELTSLRDEYYQLAIDNAMPVFSNLITAVNHCAYETGRPVGTNQTAPASEGRVTALSSVEELATKIGGAS